MKKITVAALVLAPALVLAQNKIIGGLLISVVTWAVTTSITPARDIGPVICALCDVDREVGQIWLTRTNEQEMQFLDLDKMIKRGFTPGDTVTLCDGRWCVNLEFSWRFAWEVKSTVTRDPKNKYRNATIKFMEPISDTVNAYFYNLYRTTYANGWVQTVNDDGPRCCIYIGEPRPVGGSYGAATLFTGYMGFGDTTTYVPKTNTVNY